MGNPVEFVTTLWPYAVQFQKDTGIPATWAIAMAANETGWDLTNPYLFGIKGKGPNGGSKVERTREVDANGKDYYINAEFATYGSYAEAFKHLGMQDVVRGAPRTSATDFFNSLQAHSWATDPNYAKQLVGLVNQVIVLARRYAPSPSLEDILSNLGAVGAQDPGALLPQPSQPTTGPAAQTAPSGVDLVGSINAVAQTLQSAATGIGNAAKAVATGVNGLTSLINWLGQPGVWARILLIVVGGLVTLIGLVLFAMSFGIRPSSLTPAGMAASAARSL